MADNNTTPGNQNNNSKPTLSWSQPAASKPVATPVPVTTNTPVPPVKTTTTTTAQSASTGASNSNTGTYVGIFVAGLIVGALIGWGITSNKTDSTVATTATSTAQASTSTTGNTDTTGSVDLTGSTVGSSNTNVTLAPTQQAGFAVAVTNAGVTQPTWLVVYEGHNGTPGNAIGAGLFFAGNTSGTIQLLRATLPGQSYFVGQSLDDGDKVFSLQNDKPVRDAQGNPLFTQFTAQ